MRNGIVFVLAVVLILGGYVWYDLHAKESGLIHAPNAADGFDIAPISPFLKAWKFVVNAVVPPEKPIRNLVFDCDQQKSFRVIFYAGTVHLHLSDGRDLILPTVASTSKAEYVASNGTITFTENNGEGSVEEGPDHTQTYKNCFPLTSNYS
ncbi:MAG TPA: hypothetical protein VMH91_02495 [Candidatus Paceibacterota bacterium]|nr:hypothetical protein [Candidatus Paceibacterota bacterium]